MFPVDKIAVVIPCLNESAQIAPLIFEIKKMLPKVIVVDDGSTDGTGKLASNAGAEIVRNEHPCGKGKALSTGLKKAREKNFQWALVMDGDGQHTPDDIPTFLEQLGRAPLVIGNRMANCEPMPRLRRLVNRWMSKRLSRIAGKNLPDTQCGFRLIDLEAWSQLELQTDHFEIESEMLLAFIAAGHTVEFVPIQAIYKNEQSKIHPARDTLRWFRWLRNARRQFKNFQTNLSVASPPATSPSLQNKATPSPP